jgi:hypothetical protein
VDSFSTSHANFIQNFGRYPAGIMPSKRKKGKKEKKKILSRSSQFAKALSAMGVCEIGLALGLHLTGVLIPVKPQGLLLYTYKALSIFCLFF